MAAYKKNSPSSFVVTLLIFALVLSPLLTCDAVRLVSHPAGGIGPKQPICPACVCCSPPPPGSCCKCCSSPIETQQPICPACVCCSPPQPGSCCKCCSSPIETQSKNGSP